MRTIKFKGKSLDSGEWIGGYYYKECDNTYIIEDRQNYSMLNRNEAVLIDPATVCQFTGLLDKNGVEVYDGDVLRSDEYPYSQIENDERDYYFAVIYYCKGDASFLVRRIKNPETSIGGLSRDYPFPDNVTQEEMADFEVIGSIHDFKWRQYRKYFQTKEETEETND